MPLPDEIIEDYLGHGERMIHNDHPSFRAFVIEHLILVIVLFVAAGLFVGVVLNGSLTAVLITFLVLAIVLLVLVLQRLSERYTSHVITNVRIMRVSGVLTRRVHSIPWMRVTDLTFDQTWLGRVLGYATLQIESANEEGGLRNLEGVSNPTVFNKYLVDMVVAKQGPIAPGWEELGQAGPAGLPLPAADRPARPGPGGQRRRREQRGRVRARRAHGAPADPGHRPGALAVPSGDEPILYGSPGGRGRSHRPPPPEAGEAEADRGGGEGARLATWRRLVGVAASTRCARGPSRAGPGPPRRVTRGQASARWLRSVSRSQASTYSSTRRCTTSADRSTRPITPPPDRRVEVHVLGGGGVVVAALHGVQGHHHL